MSKNKLKLNIVSQEKEILSTEVDWITVPTITGDVTILPHHISLFGQIKPGTLVYNIDGEDNLVVVSKGFVDVFPDSKVVIMIDSGVLARDISEKKAQEAVDAAKETMKTTADTC